MEIDKKLLDLANRKDEARSGGGENRIQKQHEGGKYTARERVEMLLDEGSFEEFDIFKRHRCTDFGMDTSRPYTDGVITGYGTVNGRLVFVFSQDFTIFGGSLSKAYSEKICKIMDMAANSGAPVIGINDSGGARIQEGVDALAGYTDIFLKNVMYSGVVPQISLVLGPCAGGAVYSPAITDFVLMRNESSYMFLTGPKVVKKVTAEDVTTEQLGGASIHSSVSGVAHLVYNDEPSLIDGVRELLAFLPQNFRENPPEIETDDPLDRTDDELNYIVPDNPNKAYDIREVIQRVTDNGLFFEIQENYAKNIVIGFSRLNGNSIGIVANQPAHLSGVIDNDASIKAARFVRFCDSFNIPLVVFEDVPGFMPGTKQEYGGIIRNGAKLLFAFAEATVPKITVIVRKAYGGAYCVMNSKHLRGDIVLAWPTAEIAVMGPDGAAEIVYKKELNELEGSEREQQLVKLMDKYKEVFANPYNAAEKGYIDDIIVPANTRIKLIKSLKMLSGKIDNNPEKKHGNIPL
ncbi:MAG: acyl-CoA carboxylase subunit beta [Acidobacteriota bacterium]